MQQPKIFELSQSLALLGHAKIHSTPRVGGAKVIAFKAATRVCWSVRWSSGCSAAAAGSASASLGINDGVEIEFFMILAATMLRSTTWSIVDKHIDSNELYEDLILVIVANDVFSLMKISAARQVIGQSHRSECFPINRVDLGIINVLTWFNRA